MKKVFNIITEFVLEHPWIIMILSFIIIMIIFFIFISNGDNAQTIEHVLSQPLSEVKFGTFLGGLAIILLTFTGYRK